MTTDIYPMPSFPSLVASDLGESTRWYTDGFGFELIYEMPGHNGDIALSHLRWAKYADLLLVMPYEGGLPRKPWGVGVTLNFACTLGELEQQADQARSFNAHIIEGPVDRPWNTRDLLLADPDGYRINFTAVLDPSLSFEEAMVNVTSRPGRQRRS